MPQITKPNTLNRIWADGGDKATPLNSKINSGWQIEIPPRQWFNWLDNRQDQAIAHINQHGIAVWDAETEYQANKSYAQDPVNGVIYKCLATNTGAQPSTSPVQWVKAFVADDDPRINPVPPMGVDQDWQIVTGSRSLSTTYTNTTGRTIFVSITVNSSSSSEGGGGVIGQVNGVSIVESSAPSYAESSIAPRSNVSFPVQAGKTYRAIPLAGAQTEIVRWAELR